MGFMIDMERLDNIRVCIESKDKGSTVLTISTLLTNMLGFLFKRHWDFRSVKACLSVRTTLSSRE